MSEPLPESVVEVPRSDIGREALAAADTALAQARIDLGLSPSVTVRFFAPADDSLKWLYRQWGRPWTPFEFQRGTAGFFKWADEDSAWVRCTDQHRMLAVTLHELRHLWQSRQGGWDRKTSLERELDAQEYERRALVALRGW